MHKHITLSISLSFPPYPCITESRTLEEPPGSECSDHSVYEDARKCREPSCH